MNSVLLREHAFALYEHTRNLALVRLADLGHALAAWAETRDLDTEWADSQESNR